MKMPESCRVIYGKGNFLKFVSVSIVGITIMLIGGLIKSFAEIEGFFRGFIDGFCISFCGIMNIVAAEMLILGALGAVRRVTPGYMYFHSMANGFLHFKRSFILANLTGVLLTAIYAAVGMIFFSNTLMLSMILAAFLVMGWCDLVGSSKHQWLPVLGFALTGFVFGIVSGLIDEEELELFPFFNLAVIGAGAVFYIVCLIIAFSRAEKLWSRED